MKKKLKLMHFVVLLFILCSCNLSTGSKKQTSDIKTKNSNNKSNLKMFTGNYIGTFNDSPIKAEIIENQSVISGTLEMFDSKAQIIATSKNNSFSGKILEKDTDKIYAITAVLQNETLQLFITFPELENKVIEFILKKESASKKAENTTKTSSNTTSNKEKNQKLIGIWRYTDVISSSGYGGDYASLSTDYFVQFKPNGECLSWTGSSAGGSGDSTYDSSGNSNITVEGWYTEGKTITFFDLKTKEEVSLTFFAEENRMMLKGSSSKVYVRVQ